LATEVESHELKFPWKTFLSRLFHPDFMPQGTGKKTTYGIAHVNNPKSFLVYLSALEPYSIISPAQINISQV
jgi:hypothetical protein